MTIIEAVDQMEIARTELPAHTVNLLVNCASAPAANATASSYRTHF